MRCHLANVSVESVLNIKGFDLKRTLEMDPEFLNTDNEHEHDTTVSSVSFAVEGELDLSLVQDWISNILQEKGADIYRMKGVLSIAHAEERFVYQAVHMIFNGNFMEPWTPDETRSSKLVFIGKNLDEAELRAKFNECLYTAESEAKKKAALRFAIGDKVQCKTGATQWSTGEVVALMYRESFMSPGMIAPYQVKLDSGNMIYAPVDEDEVIRKA